VQGLAAALADHFTVVTYDRRGLSSSALRTGSPAPTIRSHAEDARDLLDALGTGPAAVAGSSLGALIGLELATRHPGSVRTLLAHEPPDPRLLPSAERAVADRMLDDVEEAYALGGVGPALAVLGGMLGADPNDREPDTPAVVLTDQRLANAAFYLRYDVPAGRAWHLDADALARAGTRVLPAAGAGSGSVWTHRCAAGLGSRLGVDLVLLPGGHNGFVSHPRATAARLRSLLE
jgi:pimeloyl-ACP methyl ester carboxylesterase